MSESKELTCRFEWNEEAWRWMCDQCSYDFEFAPFDDPDYSPSEFVNYCPCCGAKIAD